MKLLTDWKCILKRAWSIRLMIVAGLLSGLEVILPLFMHELPRGLFAVLSLLVIGGAFIARILAQQEVAE